MLRTNLILHALHGVMLLFALPFLISCAPRPLAIKTELREVAVERLVKIDDALLEPIYFMPFDSDHATLSNGDLERALFQCFSALDRYAWRLREIRMLSESQSKR